MSEQADAFGTMLAEAKLVFQYVFLNLTCKGSAMVDSACSRLLLQSVAIRRDGRFGNRRDATVEQRLIFAEKCFVEKCTDELCN